MSFTSVWDEAGDSAEAEQGLRALTAARVEAAAYWPFLSAAANREDFVNRLALKDEEIAACAERQGITFEALVRSLAEDFHTIEAARHEAGDNYSPCPDHEGQSYHKSTGACSCGAKHSPLDKKESARHLAIFKVTAADDSTAYYVVDEDSDKKVGGPYDSEADARDAISGGDVEGDNLTVSKGGGDDSDSDSKDDDKGPDPDDDGDDDSSDSKDDKDDDKDDDKKGNPFAKKGSVRKVAHDDWWQSDEGKAHSQRMLQSARNEFKSGIGSYSEDQHQMPAGQPSRGKDYRPHRVYDSVSSLLNHQGHFMGDNDPQYHRESAQAHAQSMSVFNHCPSCDNVYATNHPDHEAVGSKDKCPNCGDTDFHENVGDLLADNGHYDQHHERTMYDDDHGPDYHGMDGDNHGDPYGKFDEGGAWDQHRHGSRLFPVVALADGEDPLQWIVQSVPDSEGEPEKPDEHLETLNLTGSLVDQFRQVFTATLGA